MILRSRDGHTIDAPISPTSVADSDPTLAGWM
jgi:hypothetical protein